MFLKSLKLTGFKSFADRTRLEYGPGVSVIVGPNGSGKSNVVDAVSWVLGTQSTRSLRTSKMDDVIFAGTAMRPAVGKAEVSLTFDNSSRQMALDLEDVTITRRLLRDGTSTYQLNGTECRLIDIQDLLLDSGVGRHQHVIVGQGQLDAVLNAKPADHRDVIEEAAGVLKHRLRKERAQRRLERTDEDLTRLKDIARELRRQIRPLKRQAEAALRFEELRDEVRALRLFVGGEELRTLGDRLVTIELRQSEHESSVDERTSELGELDRTVAELAQEAGVSGEALDRDSAAAAKFETLLERLRRVNQVAQERSRVFEARRTDAGERRADLTEEVATLRAQFEEASAVTAESTRALEVAETTLNRVAEEERSLSDQIEMTSEGAVAVIRGDLRSMEAAELRDGRELAKLKERRASLEVRSGEHTDSAASLSAEIRALDSLVEEHRRSYETARSAREKAQGSWEEAERSLAEARLDVASAEARLEALAMAAAGRGDDVVQQTIAARGGTIGSVIDMLDVNPDLSVALEAALGAMASASVTEDQSKLEAVIESLKSAGLGGISVVFGNTSLPGHPGSGSARTVAETMGIARLVDELGPGAPRQLAEQLLGDVLVVEGWHLGWKLVSDHPDVRAVTPEGDVLSAVGAYVADPDGASAAMLERAEVAVETSLRELARRESIHTSTTRSFADLREEERTSLERLEEHEAQLAGAAEALDRDARNEESLRSELGRVGERLEAVEASSTDRRASMVELRRRLDELEGTEDDRREAWEQMEARRLTLGDEHRQARAKRDSLAATVAATGERIKLLTDRIGNVEAELSELDAEPVAAAGAVDVLLAIAEAASEATDAVREVLAVIRTRQQGLRTLAGSAQAKLVEARELRELRRTELQHLREELSSLAIEHTEVSLRREAVAERLRRDADADEAEALAAPLPAIEDADPVQLLDQREAELRRLGPVNPLAATEYRELSDRADFLTGQLQDLETSRDSLRTVIRALDEEMATLFDQAFSEVKLHYQELFAVLFPGGKGTLELVDDDDQPGVEITAQPLGKRVSRLTLLSGGERSLAALAFLFAVFKARPSPFYILDEVEAALDDANLRRFLRLVDEFRTRAQLIIVTHQQQTMEAADVLYGITMEPGGSSQALVKTMNEALESVTRSEDSDPAVSPASV